MNIKKLKNLPFTVVYTTDTGTTVRKRVKEPKEAWRLMMENKGILHSAFRIG